MCAIAHHFGRPGTPTDQAWIESLFSHLKGDWPHLDFITDPAMLRAELAKVRQEYNTVRLHAGIGYVTPDDEHEGRGQKIATRAAPACTAPADGASTTTAPNAAGQPTISPEHPRGGAATLAARALLTGSMRDAQPLPARSAQRRQTGDAKLPEPPAPASVQPHTHRIPSLRATPKPTATRHPMRANRDPEAWL